MGCGPAIVRSMHSKRRGVFAPAGRKLKRTQPSCLRSAIRPVVQESACPSPAQRMLSETKVSSTAWTLPMTVHPCGGPSLLSSGSTPPKVSDPTPAEAVQVCDGYIRWIGRIDDGVECLELDELARAYCAKDRLPRRDRQPRPARRRDWVACRSAAAPLVSTDQPGTSVQCEMFSVSSWLVLAVGPLCRDVDQRDRRGTCGRHAPPTRR